MANHETTRDDEKETNETAQSTPNDEEETNGTAQSTLDDETDGKEHQSLTVTRSTYLYAFCAALNSCNLGYDIGVSTNAGPKLQTSFQLTNVQLELFLGSINFWSVFGAMCSPIVSDKYGRRSTFLTAAIGFIIGIGVMAMAPNFYVVMVGRMIVGIAVGIGEAVDPLYIAELSPSHIRGELVSWAEAGVAAGVVLGFCSSLLFFRIPNTREWRYMIALGAVLPTVMIYLIRNVMPESPRWLVAQNQPHAARVVLEQIYPPGTNVDDIVQEIQESIELEQDASHAIGWSAIFRPTPAVRRMLTVGIGIAIIQQAIGIDSIMFYLMFVIQQTGITNELEQIAALIVLGVVKFLFVFVGAKLFDKVGRRPLLFTSLLGCAASLLVVSATFSSTSVASKLLTVIGLALYLAFFSSGIGPGNWVVVSEIFATSIRAKAMSLAVLPNRLTATIMASTFLSVAHALTWPGFFLLLAGICVASAFFLHKYLPETKDRSLEQMAVYFAEVTGDRSILDVEAKLAGKHHPPTQDLEMSTLCAPSTEIESLAGHLV